MARGSNRRDGRVARSEGVPYDSGRSNAFFDVMALTTGFKGDQKTDLESVASKLEKGLGNLDEATKARVFDSFKSNGQTGYYLDKPTVDFVKEQAEFVWERKLQGPFRYLKYEFPDEFKEFTKDWAFSKTSTTPTVEAKAKDIFMDAMVRRVSALVNGAKGGDDGKLALKNYERMQQYAPYEYKANQTKSRDFQTAVTSALNDAVFLTREVVLDRMEKVLYKDGNR